MATTIPILVVRQQDDHVHRVHHVVESPDAVMSNCRIPEKNDPGLVADRGGGAIAAGDRAGQRLTDSLER